jgi:hypothetical protein
MRLAATIGGIDHEQVRVRGFFTADNWFHQDQFSGTGGWMGSFVAVDVEP